MKTLKILPRNWGKNAKPQPENKKPQPSIQHTTPHQPIENKEGVIYYTEIENTLKNKKKNTGFFKTHEDRGRVWIWNGYPVNISRGTEVHINDHKNIISPGIQKVLFDSTYKTAKSLNDKDKVVSGDLLKKTNYFDRITTKGRIQVVIKLLKMIFIMM